MSEVKDLDALYSYAEWVIESWTDSSVGISVCELDPDFEGPEFVFSFGEQERHEYSESATCLPEMIEILDRLSNSVCELNRRDCYGPSVETSPDLLLELMAWVTMNRPEYLPEESAPVILQTFLKEEACTL